MKRPGRRGGREGGQEEEEEERQKSEETRFGSFSDRSFILLNIKNSLRRRLLSPVTQCARDSLSQSLPQFFPGQFYPVLSSLAVSHGLNRRGEREEIRKRLIGHDGS